MVPSAIATTLTISVAVAVGCSSIERAPQMAVQPSFEAPSVWLDLPASPLEVSYLGSRAVLADRTGEGIKTITIGCVRESNGTVAVVAQLWVTDLSDGVWTREYPNTLTLEDISRLYREPELIPSATAIRRCPADSKPAIVQASSRSSFTWSAEGTPWPKGPPHDTRNTWKVTARMQPSFQYVSSGGCSDADLYASNQTDTEMLWVRLELNRKKLPTARRPKVVKLTSLSRDEKVQIHVYQTDRHDWFCSDVAFWESEAPAVWLPRSGTLTVWAEPQGKDTAEYLVTVQIHEAEFVGPGGAMIRPPRTIEIKALAGGMVGG